MVSAISAIMRFGLFPLFPLDFSFVHLLPKSAAVSQHFQVSSFFPLIRSKVACQFRLQSEFVYQSKKGVYTLCGSVCSPKWSICQPTTKAGFPDSNCLMLALETSFSLLSTQKKREKATFSAQNFVCANVSFPRSTAII